MKKWRARLKIRGKNDIIGYMEGDITPKTRLNGTMRKTDFYLHKLYPETTMSCYNIEDRILQAYRDGSNNLSVESFLYEYKE